MTEELTRNYSYIRLIIFIVGFVFLGGIEFFFPNTKRVHSQTKRWGTNISLSVVNSLLVKSLVVIPPAYVALWCLENNVGLFYVLRIPYYVEVILSIIVLDLIIYFQHRLFHYIPFLWKIHRVHHSDQDIDVSTAVRFHPVEILLSVLIKSIVIVLLGSSLVSVLIFEIILNGMAMFNHSNIRLNKKIDQLCSLLIVTPNMHLFHHSIKKSETNSNFGFNFSFWDKLFSTYTNHFKHEKPQNLGLEKYLCKLPINLIKLIKLPFYKSSETY